MRLRIKTSKGSGVLNNEKVLTVADLVSEIKIMGLLDDSVDDITIKNGFPPRPVECSTESLLVDILRSGDQVIIEVDGVGIGSKMGHTNGASSTTDKSGNKSITPSQSTRPDKMAMETIPSVYNESMDAYALLRNVPDDNSCMFNAVAYALLGVQENAQPEVDRMRGMVAREILSNPKYSEVILGKPVDEYAEWIQKMDSWGGAIELGILAANFNVALLCLDVETGKIIRFQLEENPPSNFVVLVYSGIHYDVIARNKECLTQDKPLDVCVFEEDSVDGDTFIVDCQKLCALLQQKNYVTNTTTFRVRCLECYEILVGEMGASNHANATNHFRFGEVK